MKQFNLEEWLQDKSRKVVTRDGRPVRIVCYDMKSVSPIIGVILHRLGGEFERNYATNGRFSTQNESEYDLFFADEEDELTEFEKQLGVYIYFPKLSCKFNKEEKEYIRNAANTLLNLAKNEIEKSIEEGAIEFAKSYMEDVNPSFEKVKESEELWKWKMSCLGGINKAYTKGKQDALKDLPKWKKVDSNPAKFQYNLQGTRLYKDGEYYIELSDLETLPKEE